MSNFPDTIWHNGQFKPWAQATTHVMTHALHYGSSVFEGIRSYATPNGHAIFRLNEHIKRFFNSARIYDLAVNYTPDEIRAACFELLKKNDLTSGYLRPIVFRGPGSFGLGADNPTEMSIAAWVWGPYLGHASAQGVDVCISSWQRLAPNTVPAMAKAGGNYLSSTLISREAKRLGFDEGIGLSRDGLLSEGAGENLFVMLDNVVYTTTLGSSILNGITRHTAITLAKKMGYEVREQPLPREFLYFADEAFFTGTAAEITPIRSVDRKTFAHACPGPITTRIREAFFGLFNGTTQDEWGWLDHA